jgi:hypothetical protein
MLISDAVPDKSILDEMTLNVLHTYLWPNSSLFRDTTSLPQQG